MKYSFSLPDGNHLIAIWLPIDGADDFPGESMNISIQGIKAYKVLAQDPLNGVEQVLKFHQKDAELEIPRVMVKDYPLFIKIIQR